MEKKLTSDQTPPKMKGMTIRDAFCFSIGFVLGALFIIFTVILK